MKRKKKYWIFICIGILLLICYMVPKINRNNKYKVINNQYLKEDIINALNEINADDSKISKFEKINSWTGGERYSFIYDDKIALTIYCNIGSTVESINFNDVKIYHRGYEAYDINKYVYNSSYIENLQLKTEEVVSLYLNYPYTAQYSYKNSDWRVARYNDIYYLSSSVKASNAFGVYSTINFKIAYHIIEENGNIKYKPIYLSLNGKEKFNDLDSYKPSEERKTAEPKNPSKNMIPTSGINLTYGRLGEYGKEEIIDGEKYIFYYIPSGKYALTNYGYSGVVFVASNEMKKNSAGYLESVDLKTYTFESDSYGETKQIEIPPDYHVEISMHTIINLQIVNP